MGNTRTTAGDFPAFRIEAGIAPRLQDAAAGLYLRHFGAQVLPFPVPAARAERFIRAAMQPRMVLAALDGGGGLIGLLGLRDAGGGFLGMTADARAALGAFAGVTGALMPLFRPGPATADMVIDGLAIADRWQRRGVGRALLAHALADAARRGYPGLRAEVALRNRAALRFYEAAGFSPQGSHRIGWPWSASWLGRAAVMRRDVP